MTVDGRLFHALHVSIHMPSSWKLILCDLHVAVHCIRADDDHDDDDVTTVKSTFTVQFVYLTKP